MISRPPAARSVPVLLLLCAAAARMAHAQASWQAPAFCKGLDCPKYSVLKTLGDGVELRRYEPGQWVSLKTAAVDKDAAMRGSFMKLFDYISGGNAAKAKIAMTAPVVTKIEPGQGPNCESTFTISFFNPWKYQGAAAAAAPQPTGQGVFIANQPAMEVWVLPYGGFSSAATDRDKAAELMRKLDAAKEPYSSAPWYTAGYDSPYTLANRRNEVWLPRAAAGAGTTAAEAGSKASSKGAGNKPAAASGR